MTLDLRSPNLHAQIFMPRAGANCMLASGTLFAWAFAPKIARAEGRDPRLLTIVLRGALDGLAAVAPVGDPDWIALRGDKALTLAGATAGLPLDSFFALNPAMPNLHRLYQAGAATIVHAAATPYRERSHFDGQDVLESGVLRPGASETGWLNRALGTLAPDGARRHGQPRRLRGRPHDPAGGARPRSGPVLDAAAAAARQRRHHDAAARSLSPHRSGAGARPGGAHGPGRHRARRRTSQADQKPQPGGAAAPGPAAQVRAYFAESAGMAGKFLAQPDGPRIGALAFDGWDTHADEGAINGRLAALLGALDGALAAIETNMGPAWRDTVVVVVTEFGRTARINGTEGTDHGTATVAFLAGGAAQRRPRHRGLAGPQAGATCRTAATSSPPPTCAPW